MHRCHFSIGPQQMPLENREIYSCYSCAAQSSVVRYFWSVNDSFPHFTFRPFLHFQAGHTISDPCLILSGVPQGSLINYMSDPPCSIPENIKMYTAEFILWGAEHAVVQSAVNDAKRWSIECGLLINNYQCVGVSFGKAPVQHFWTTGNIENQDVENQEILRLSQ